MFLGCKNIYISNTRNLHDTRCISFFFINNARINIFYFAFLFKKQESPFSQMNKPNNSLYEYLDLNGYQNIKIGRQTLPYVLALWDPQYNILRIYNISEYFWVVRGICYL